MLSFAFLLSVFIHHTACPGEIWMLMVSGRALCKIASHSGLGTSIREASNRKIESFNMDLNVRNGKYIYQATNLTANSKQTVMAQVVYKLGGKTYTIHTEPVSCGPFIVQ